MNRVSILAAGDYIPQLLDEAVENHFKLLELDKLVRAGMRVVLKPNLLMKRAPEEATTTHPALVAAVARALKRRGVTDITLADSPGGLYTAGTLNAVYRVSGMSEMASREGVRLNTDTGWAETPAAGKRVNSFRILRPVREADLVINLCKLKTHCMTGLSGAVKNLFGCIPGLQKPEFHYRFQKPDDFCDMLVDLCETVCPAITFVDAIVAMEGDGPSGGTPLRTGLTLCATNPYDLDVVLCALIHMPEERAYTVRASRARGLAARLEDIELAGDAALMNSIPKFRLPASKTLNFNNRLPKWAQSAANRFTESFVVPRPVIREKECIGCGKCAESCPAKTIVLAGGKAVIHYEACIKCFCCHEMCPVKAISVRRNRFFSK